MINSIKSKMFKRLISGLSAGPLRYPKPAYNPSLFTNKCESVVWSKKTSQFNKPEWIEDCIESKIDASIRKGLEEKFKKDGVKIHKKEKNDGKTLYFPKYGNSLYEPDPIKEKKNNKNSFRKFHNYNKMSVSENKLFILENDIFWIP
jgi:hypothetical protein